MTTPRQSRRPSLTQIAHQHLRETVQRWRTRHTDATTGVAAVPPLAIDATPSVATAPLLAIDATAGNGHDTLFLAQLLGVSGEVAAFDIQPQALENTAERLRQYAEGSGTPRPHPLQKEERSPDSGSAPDADVPPAFAARVSPSLAQVRLVLASHEEMLAQLPAQWQGAVCAIAFNLGYLPGGDKKRVTLPQSTLQALDASLRLLAPGGLLSVLCYRGHSEGKSETDAIAHWLETLPEGYNHTFIHAAADAPPHAPVLLHIERNG